jgi:MtN3 and saliva related transmembrane protein
MDSTTLIGLMAGALTTVALLPQVAKIYKTKSARDISLGMFIVFCVGVALWVVYGILLNELAIVIWNTVTLVLGLAIVSMKLAYG